MPNFVLPQNYLLPIGNPGNTAFAMVFNASSDCQSMCLYAASFPAGKRGQSHPDRKEITLPPQWADNGLQ